MKAFEAIFGKAEVFLPENIINYIKNIQPLMAWSSDEQNIVIQYENEDGFQFIIYSLHEKSQKVAFDHLLLANLINEKLKETVDPNRLPITQFYFVETHVLRLKVRSWMWDYNFQIQTFIPAEEYNTSMDHCPSIQELWGFTPVSIYPKLRSPDSQWELSIQKYNLFLFSHVSRETYQITFDGQKDFSYGTPPDTNLSSISLQQAGVCLPPLAIWSPDSKSIVTFQCDQRSVAALPLLQHVHSTEKNLRPQVFSPKIPLVGDADIPKIYICIIDVASQSLFRLESLPLQPALVGSPLEAGYIEWSKNSKKIYFLKEERGYHQLSLYELDILSKNVRMLWMESSLSYVEPSPLLMWKNYSVMLEQEDKFIWLSVCNGWWHLYLHQLSTGQRLAPITQGEWNVRKIVYVDKKDKWVYFLASQVDSSVDPYLRFLYRVKFQGTNLQLLTPEKADHTISFSPQGNYFITSYSTMAQVPETKLYTKTGQLKDKLFSADFSKLHQLGYQHPVSFSVKSKDGKFDIYGVIYKPSDFDPDKKYPVIDDIYPGPQLTRVPKTFCFDPPEYFYGPWWPQALAELGYIVVNIDGRGTPLRSQQFHLHSYQQIEKASDLTDHLHFIKNLAKHYSYIDINRIGIIGHSAGGYAATRALLQYPDFFQVGVCVSGLQDLRAYLAFWGEKYQGEFGQVDYSVQSNYPLAKNLQGKLLLIHGDLDDNVHPCNMLQLADALISADKNFEMLLVPNGNHGLYFTHNYVKKRIWQFFKAHL